MRLIIISEKSKQTKIDLELESYEKEVRKKIIDGVLDILKPAENLNDPFLKNIKVNFEKAKANNYQ